MRVVGRSGERSRVVRREVTSGQSRGQKSSDHPVLPARSAILSLMLGSHPARWSPAQLSAAAMLLEIAPSTMRTALTRAVAAGDLDRLDGDYVLGGRLVRRQARQDEAVLDAESAWDGSWEMAVVTVTGRGGAERAALRDLLAEHRLAELREGVWMRPANLTRPRRYDAEPVLATLSARPGGDPARLADRLWDLDGWARRAHDLLDAFDTHRDPAPRLASAAGLVRHLSTDPLLPADLLPADWPGGVLRATYRSYVDELRRMLHEG